MKIRAQIILAVGNSFTFEHAGPVVRIGRDPDGELSLEGEASQSVSWNHAQIDLRPEGATVTDLNSTNGTFVNDRRVTAPAPFNLGDQIQLGYTGPMLKIVELDLTPNAVVKPIVLRDKSPAPRPAARTPPPPPREPKPRPVTRGPVQAAGAATAADKNMPQALLIGLGIAAVLLLLLITVLMLRPNRAGTEVSQNPPVKDPAPTVPPPSTGSQENPSKPADKSNGSGASDQPKKENGKTDDPKNVPPAPERKNLGWYVTQAKDPPSILLQRQSNATIWSPLRPNTPVYPGDSLISLPGYRSRVYLDSGLHLTLWGNVPEFSNMPRLLESKILLQAPAAGIDSELTLDRGRIHLGNYKDKPAGPLTVRVHFQQESWDVTLPDQKSEVVLESWGTYLPGVPFSKEREGKPLLCLGLSVQGSPAKVKAGGKEYTVPNLGQFVWSNDSPTPIGPETLSRAPEWWTDRIPLDRSEVANMLSALTDLSTQISKREIVLDVLGTLAREGDTTPGQVLGVFCLGAVDAIEQVVNALESRDNPHVRGAAIFVLRLWTSRGPDGDLELYRVLQDKKGYSAEKAAIILSLLHDFSLADVQNPATYQKLIDYLAHDNLAIRELALSHLTLLDPGGLNAIKYDAASDVDLRKAAIEQWRKRIPPGSLPPRSGAARTR